MALQRLHAYAQGQADRRGGLQWEDLCGADEQLQPQNKRLGRAVGELDVLFTPHARDLGPGSLQGAANLRCGGCCCLECSIMVEEGLFGTSA